MLLEKKICLCHSLPQNPSMDPSCLQYYPLSRAYKCFKIWPLPTSPCSSSTTRSQPYKMTCSPQTSPSLSHLWALVRAVPTTWNSLFPLSSTWLIPTHYSRLSLAITYYSEVSQSFKKQTPKRYIQISYFRATEWFCVVKTLKIYINKLPNRLLETEMEKQKEKRQTGE